MSLLFFLHGAKLSRQAIYAGMSHWRLHCLIIASSFLLFPFLGWALKPVFLPLLTPELYWGMLFLCCLPATVQSAIAFTAVARGNVPAAICSASASTLLGIIITPILVGMLLGAQVSGAGNAYGLSEILRSIRDISMQLLLPFVAGHAMRPLIGEVMQRNSKIVKCVDQSSILVVVYTAFSAAVIEGLWKHLPLSALVGLFVACSLLLALSLCSTTQLARRLGFSKEDEITIVFCGSKKSLASGIPMANVLFSASAVGAMVLPLMLFHQMQLMVCAVLAQRYAKRA